MGVAEDSVDLKTVVVDVDDFVVAVVADGVVRKEDSYSAKGFEIVVDAASLR